ncbi:hypothetical protein DMP17_22225 [Pseudonocardia sp. TMWB2A]|uniref:hypothetical protein n=1 Tax=Pseudonocardia sp. TMWB2A TaxID=687430 RepID=UPI00307F884E
MPATYIHSFAPRGVSGSPAPAWHHTSADTDTALTTWAETNIPADGDPGCGDFTVDRSGPAPRLTWRHFESTYDPSTGDYVRTPTGTGDAVDLVDGQLYIGWKNQHSQPWRVASAATVTGGYWESDQHGRPFDLDDLLAGS